MVFAQELDLFIEFPQETCLVRFDAGVAVFFADVTSDADRPEIVQTILAAGFAASGAICNGW